MDTAAPVRRDRRYGPKPIKESRRLRICLTNKRKKIERLESERKRLLAELAQAEDDLARVVKIEAAASGAAVSA